MTRTITIGEAKTHLSRLLASVQAGEEIVIARGHEPVARLVPLTDRREEGIKAAIAGLKGIRSRAKPVTSEDIVAWKNEGHR